ncbi:hypothetical protein GCM10018987_34040 [Streptomyces cremeus]
MARAASAPGSNPVRSLESGEWFMALPREGWGGAGAAERGGRRGDADAPGRDAPVREPRVLTRAQVAGRRR